LKCGESRWPLAPPAVTAIARSVSPNSTAATKLLPELPYHFFVPGQGRAPNEASEPQMPLVNGTARLGWSSSKRGSIRSSMRWKRLTSPHGVFQVPNTCVSVSEAAWSVRRRSPAAA
jgi:hypothetical protein